MPSPLRFLKMTGLAAVLLGGCSAGSLDSPAVAAPMTTQTGFLLPGLDGPHAVAIADLNNDTYNEVIVTQSYAGKLTILWGSATQPPVRQDYLIGGAPYALIATPLVSSHGPGFADLVLTDNEAGTVRVFINSGLPAQTGDPPMTLPFVERAGGPIAVGGSPVALVSGKLNDDTQPDVAVLSARDGAVRVLLNQPARPQEVFAAAPPSYPVGEFAYSLTLAAPTVASGAQDVYVTSGLSDQLYVLRNDQSGGLTADPAQAVAVPRGPVFVTTLPASNSHSQQLLVASAAADQVSVLSRSSKPTAAFERQQSVDASSKPLALALGNFQITGWPGFAVALNGTDQLDLFVMSGSGEFASALATKQPTSPSPIAVATGRVLPRCVGCKERFDDVVVLSAQDGMLQIFTTETLR